MRKTLSTADAIEPLSQPCDGFDQFLPLFIPKITELWTLRASRESVCGHKGESQYLGQSADGCEEAIS